MDATDERQIQDAEKQWKDGFDAGLGNILAEQIMMRKTLDEGLVMVIERLWRNW